MRAIDEIISQVVNETLGNRKPIVEGVKYIKDTDTFVFDFRHDTDNDIIVLTNNGLEQSEIFNQCFFFKYKFGSEVDSSVRAKFIEHVKFGKDINEDDLELFIKKAVDSLSDTIDLWNCHTVIHPQSLSNVNRKMLSYLRMFGHPDFLSFEMVKVPSSDMTFGNVLIIDDVKTSGTSLMFVIETIKKVNPQVKIVVFSLIGKE